MNRIILLSGGLDSATLLYAALKKGGEIIAAFYDYGQKAAGRERAAAENLCRIQNVRLLVFDLSSVFRFSQSTLLSRSAEPRMINENDVALPCESTKTLVEFRNGVMLAAAVSLAEQVFPQANVEISYGAAKTRESIRDCDAVFAERMAAAARFESDGRVTVVAPYADLGKDKILSIAEKNGVPVSETWSCYEGGEQPCGVCPACLDRIALGVFR